MAAGNRRHSLDTDALLAQADKAITAAEYAHATWQQRIDEQRHSSRTFDRVGQEGKEKERARANSPAVADTSFGIHRSMKVKNSRSSPVIKRESEKEVRERQRERERGKEKEKESERAKEWERGRERERGRGNEKETESKRESGKEKEKEGRGENGAAIAVQAFSIGVAAMEDGDFGRAALFFKEAASKCPPERHAALEKIERYMTSALEKLRELEVREKRDASETRMKEGRAPSKGVESSGFDKFDLQNKVKEGDKKREPDFSSLEFLGRSKSESKEVMDEKDDDREISYLSSVSLEPDAEMADSFFRAGVTALEEGSHASALKHLKIAAIKCPPEKGTAAKKIQKIIAKVQAELRN